MKTKTSTMLTKLSASTFVLSGAMLLAMSCMSTTSSNADAAAPVAQKSGSTLWAQNCRRCHNFRSPSDYSDSEWEAAMFHMRIRANLTGDEYELIREFLKSSN